MLSGQRCKTTARFLKPFMKSENMYKNLNDEELNAIIKQEKSKGKRGCLVMSLGLLVGLAYAFFGEPLTQYIAMESLNNFVIIICGSILFLGLSIHAKAKKNVKSQVGEQIIFSALNDVFSEVTYLADRHLGEEIIARANMNFPFSYNIVSGNDYVAAKYKNVSIVLSDIRLILETESDGRAEKSTQFEGLWLICDFHKKLSTELRISEGSNFFNQGVKTDNEAFNKQFYIDTQNPHEAFYILTPHMMEYIQAMDAQARGRTYMCFLREGKVHIAINSGRNAFEIKGLNEDAAVLRERFQNEIKCLTDIIDELKFIDTFFAENI